ncbi:DNA-binding protein [Acuticoccus sediminis]|uniref:DNA-binding protein n=1 Tax=Acuticoccus sediminis TaxID=2184697 RepID=A0A8B2P1C0_9HYPH|nr:hemolysin family protein [Acuticoccus sediminis]RAI02580.1 DNA-binding protein [Acuticoccus sediminis]
MLFELSIVLALTLLNGLLAMSELAIVSSRPTRLRVMADEGRGGAAAALRLSEEPGRFLSSVQIGITLVGVLSGAFSGATLGARLAEQLMAWGVPESLAQSLGVGGVVVVITYLSLIIGELVPKQIALRAPEAVAARIAPLMQAIAVGAAPLVWLLDRSGKAVLALVGQSGAKEPDVSDAEVRQVLSEARSAGVMEHAETQMIAGVMRVADRSARDLMTPRHEVIVLDLADPPEEIVHRARESRRTRLPVRDGGAHDIAGVLAAHDLLDGDGPPADLRSRLVPAPVVRDGMPALDLIETLRTSPAHMVLVYDEYGDFEGIVTPMNILEAIAGDFGAIDGSEEKMVTRADGSLLVAGWMPVDEFADHLGVAIGPGRAYSTVAGLVLDEMGRLPHVGETFLWKSWTIEIVDLDGRRIDKLLVSRVADTAGD